MDPNQDNDAQGKAAPANVSVMDNAQQQDQQEPRPQGRASSSTAAPLDLLAGVVASVVKNGDRADTEPRTAPVQRPPGRRRRPSLSPISSTSEEHAQTRAGSASGAQPAAAERVPETEHGAGSDGQGAEAPSNQDTEQQETRSRRHPVLHSNSDNMHQGSNGRDSSDGRDASEDREGTDEREGSEDREGSSDSMQGSPEMTGNAQAHARPASERQYDAFYANGERRQAKHGSRLAQSKESMDPASQYADRGSSTSREPTPCPTSRRERPQSAPKSRRAPPPSDDDVAVTGAQGESTEIAQAPAEAKPGSGRARKSDTQQPKLSKAARRISPAPPPVIPTASGPKPKARGRTASAVGHSARGASNKRQKLTKSQNSQSRAHDQGSSTPRSGSNQTASIKSRARSSSTEPLPDSNSSPSDENEQKSKTRRSRSPHRRGSAAQHADAVPGTAASKASAQGGGNGPAGAAPGPKARSRKTAHPDGTVPRGTSVRAVSAGRRQGGASRAEGPSTSSDAEDDGGGVAGSARHSTASRPTSTGVQKRPGAAGTTKKQAPRSSSTGSRLERSSSTPSPAAVTEDVPEAVALHKPDSGNLSDLDDEKDPDGHKRALRAERNRQSAAASRERKKRHVKELESKVRYLGEVLAGLQHRLHVEGQEWIGKERQWRAENESLRAQLAEVLAAKDAVPTDGPSSTARGPLSAGSFGAVPSVSADTQPAAAAISGSSAAPGGAMASNSSSAQRISGSAHVIQQPVATSSTRLDTAAPPPAIPAVAQEGLLAHPQEQGCQPPKVHSIDQRSTMLDRHTGTRPIQPAHHAQLPRAGLLPQLSPQPQPQTQLTPPPPGSTDTVPSASRAVQPALRHPPVHYVAAPPEGLAAVPHGQQVVSSTMRISMDGSLDVPPGRLVYTSSTQPQAHAAPSHHVVPLAQPGIAHRPQEHEEARSFVPTQHVQPQHMHLQPSSATALPLERESHRTQPQPHAYAHQAHTMHASPHSAHSAAVSHGIPPTSDMSPVGKHPPPQHRHSVPIHAGTVPGPGAQLPAISTLAPQMHSIQHGQHPPPRYR